MQFTEHGVSWRVIIFSRNGCHHDILNNKSDTNTISPLVNCITSVFSDGPPNHRVLNASGTISIAAFRLNNTLIQGLTPFYDICESVLVVHVSQLFIGWALGHVNQ